MATGILSNKLRHRSGLQDGNNFEELQDAVISSDNLFLGRWRTKVLQKAVEVKP